MYATVAAVVAVLGGTMSVTLPADRKVADLEQRVAQTWQQQQQYHERRELEDVRWQMQYISNEINRLNQIPKYLNRSLTDEERWQIDQLKQDFQLLKQREQALIKGVG